MRIFRKTNKLMSYKTDKLIKGVSLVEGILAAGLLGILVMALVGLFIYGQESTRIAGDRARAVFLAEEGIEAFRNIRDSATGFANVPADGTYGLDVSGNNYILSGSSDTVDIFTREIIITSETAPTRKKARARVTWNISVVRTGEVEIENHFTDWQ